MIHKSTLELIDSKSKYVSRHSQTWLKENVLFVVFETKFETGLQTLNTAPRQNNELWADLFLQQFKRCIFN